MNKLDGNDFLQVIAIFFALFIGFLPNVKSMKSQNNEINRFGWGMIFLFGISVLAAVFSTVSKSVSDKEEYSKLFDSTIETLSKSNTNLRKSDSILSLQGASIDTLKNLQNSEYEIQAQNISLGKKSDSLQTKSKALNSKLLEEIILQKEITKTTDSIVSRLENQHRNTERYNQLRLLLSITDLKFSKFILYDGLSIADFDVDSARKKVQNLYLKFQNSKINQKTPDSLNIHIQELETAAKILTYELDKSIGVYIQNLHKTVYYLIKDSSAASYSIKNYFERTLALLDAQMSNPALQKNNLVFNFWYQFFNDLYVKRALYFADKSTLNSVQQIKLLAEALDKFIDKVEKNSNLKVILDD